MINLDGFQRYIRETWGITGSPNLKTYEGLRRAFIQATGIAGEAGEAANIMKKEVRDAKDPELQEKLLLELGDVLNYLTIIAYDHGWTLEEVADANVRKLNLRHGRFFVFNLDEQV